MKSPLLVQAADREDVDDLGGLLQSELDVVTQQIDAITQAREIARNAVVRCGDMTGGKKLGRD